MPEEAAEATLVLILKGSKPMSLHEFRPLSLCNVVSKLVSKVIMSRLKGVLKELISPYQASFVPGRQGIENAIICQEFVHLMRFTKARRGATIIKVDLDKAYDRMEWSFLDQTVEDAGLPVQLIDVIMQSLSRGSCRLIWNGETTDMIKPNRGLHQEDPLSPYLFVLCIERLWH